MSENQPLLSLDINKHDGDDYNHPIDSPKKPVVFSKRAFLWLAITIVLFGVVLAVLDLQAPSNADIYHHLNVTCPLECSSTSKWSWIIQCTEAVLIASTLMIIWYVFSLPSPVTAISRVWCSFPCSALLWGLGRGLS